MSTESGRKPVEILLVEDDPDDVQFAREGLEEGGVPHRLNVVPDGVEALAYLRRQGRYSGSPRPDLILLDLQLPKKGGFEVLQEIKADESLRKIPVIVLTTSDAPDDMLKAQNLQASLYITKSSDLSELHRVMNSFDEFSLTVVKLPAEE